MRLVRYGERGQERPGVLDSQGLLRDLSGVVRDIDGAALMPDSLDRLRALDLSRLPEVPGPVRLGACVGNVRAIVC
ncbi:MAG TPA: ureidoglycolate lyase, partial [Gemmatimonadales bacterium]|nr:ureidoglycolate lyase [Gemmatimonadales bacterium]